jgi:hypothetical protein
LLQQVFQLGHCGNTFQSSALAMVEQEGHFAMCLHVAITPTVAMVEQDGHFAMCLHVAITPTVIVSLS